VLVGSGQDAVTQILQRKGLCSTRRYTRLGGPKALVPVFNAAYARFIGRSTELPEVLAAEAGPAQAASGRVATARAA
jgi:hypothetical protein